MSIYEVESILCKVLAKLNHVLEVETLADVQLKTQEVILLIEDKIEQIEKMAE